MREPRSARAGGSSTLAPDRISEKKKERHRIGDRWRSGGAAQVVRGDDAPRGLTSLGPVLATLGAELVLVENLEAFKQIGARLANAGTLNASNKAIGIIKLSSRFLCSGQEFQACTIHQHTKFTFTEFKDRKLARQSLTALTLHRVMEAASRPRARTRTQLDPFF